MRLTMQALESDSLKDYIEGETPPLGMLRISSASSDAELDRRVSAMSWSWFHAGGTASMGKVVDSQCRVYGVKGLRVVDTSIMLLSITAHLQAPMYAVAESAAEMILQAGSKDLSWHILAVSSKMSHVFLLRPYQCKHIFQTSPRHYEVSDPVENVNRGL